MEELMNRLSKIAFGAFILLALMMKTPIAGAQTLDELHKLALKEGGTVNFYGTLAQINAERILPVFEKRFPGMKVNHVDATADKLAARAITEARGGRVLPPTSGRCAAISNRRAGVGAATACCSTNR